MTPTNYSACIRRGGHDVAILGAAEDLTPVVPDERVQRLVPVTKNQRTALISGLN
jgi:hypothetical protein